MGSSGTVNPLKDLQTIKHTCTRDHNIVGCPSFVLKAYNLRCYVEGYELDVQDPTFFMDEEEYNETKETLEEMLNTYVDLPMAQ